MVCIPNYKLFFVEHILIFSKLGDDGKVEIESSGLIKETESSYTLWCSGRTCCEGMLVELKFIKVITIIYNIFMCLNLCNYFRDKI